MNDPKEKAKPGLLVEDTTVAGGVNEDGAPVVVPKDQEGHVAKTVKPTDDREAAKD